MHIFTYRWKDPITHSNLTFTFPQCVGVDWTLTNSPPIHRHPPGLQSQTLRTLSVARQAVCNAALFKNTLHSSQTPKDTTYHIIRLSRIGPRLQFCSNTILPLQAVLVLFTEVERRCRNVVSLSSEAHLSTGGRSTFFLMSAPAFKFSAVCCSVLRPVKGVDVWQSPGVRAMEVVMGLKSTSHPPMEFQQSLNLQQGLRHCFQKVIVSGRSLVISTSFSHRQIEPTTTP